MSAAPWWLMLDCDDACAEHVDGCDGFCDHTDSHLNGCLLEVAAAPIFDALVEALTFDPGDVEHRSHESFMAQHAQDLWLTSALAANAAAVIEPATRTRTKKRRG